MIHLKDFNSYENISENLKYHIDNDLSILENVFRPGSDSFFSLLKEARDLYENGYVSFSDLDKELFETTDIGKFAEFALLELVALIRKPTLACEHQRH